MRLTGTRHTSVRVEMLDRDETPLGPLGGIQGGKISYSVAATVKSSGSIQALDRGQEIDWLTVRLQPILTVNGTDYPLGVFLPSAPVEEWSATGMARDIAVLDKLTILDQDQVASTYSLAEGTNVISAVRALITDAGEQAGALTDSDETLRGNVVWEPGTSRLRIINDILEAAGYFSLWCDTLGQYRAEPYVAPATRPVVWTARDGSDSVRLADFTRDHDVYSIPNRVVTTSRSSGDEEALVSVAENTNPDSPTSIPARGRVITHTETDIEATSQEALDTHATRRLVELSSAVATLQIAHAFMPGLELNSAVRFQDTDSAYDVRTVLQRMEVPLTATGLVTSTLREVTE